MHIHDYHTAAGKNLIKEYLQSLPHTEMYVGYHIRHMLHACKKQKDKAEQFEVNTAKRRAIEIGLTI